MSFEVQTQSYEGPISLLLSLITAQKVDLWELSVSDLVDSYVAELDKMRQLDLEIATEFVVVASTLLELKCRRLFPSSEYFDPDEELAFFEERDLLLARLLEAKTFRDASHALATKFESAFKVTPRAGIMPEPFVSMVPDVLAGITAKQLADSLLRLSVSQQLEEVDTSHLPPHGITIAQAARMVVNRLSTLEKSTFREIMNYAESKLEVVVGFLAVLELYRQARLVLEQRGPSEDIVVEWVSDSFSHDELDEFLESAGFNNE